MLKTTLVVCGFLFVMAAAVAQERDSRIAELERRLAETRNHVVELQKTVDLLSSELTALSKPAEPVRSQLTEQPKDERNSYTERILKPDLGHDERGAEISGRPELFVQSRYQALPLRGLSQSDAPSNFNLTRMESRWSGRLSDKVGMGFEIQYHPAPSGASFEMVNDAFLEYYPNSALTVRAGQFVKPFGFDIQQSSSEREGPERGIFAGYFFPGQRDRGVMLTANLESLGNGWRGVQIFAAALNGNRFFIDSNRQLNYNLRVRKTFSAAPLAIGASVQIGHQLLPDGLAGNNRENLYGIDLQWVWGRLGVRAEYVAGNMPSTLLNLTPEFSPSFRPGAHSSGGAILSNLRLTRIDGIYWRYDQFNGDPVSGLNIRAFDFGYIRQIGDHSRMGIAYQFKNRQSFNDDRLNTRLHLMWNVVY